MTSRETVCEESGNDEEQNKDVILIQDMYEDSRTIVR